MTLYDGHGEVIEQANGHIEQDLRPGLYTVRVERAGRLVEQVLRHEQGTSAQIHAPLRESAAPLFGTLGTHEYYAYTSADWSRKDTRQPLGAPARATGRLFLFLRASDQQRYHGDDLGSNLLLMDAHGLPYSYLTPSERESNATGWTAFSAAAEPGIYYLRYSLDPREMPLHVFPGIHTQLFVTYERRLRFETAAILMPFAHAAFQPDDEIAVAADAALGGMQQGKRNFLPDRYMRTLFDDVFVDPMLGLLGTHLLLQRADQAWERIELVLGNLEQLLPNSPDVDALRVIAAHRYDKPMPNVVFEHPPMLRHGFEAVLRLVATYPQLLPEFGLLEAAGLRLLVDSPLSSWRPLSGRQQQARTGMPGSAEAALPPGEESVPEWVEQYAAEASEQIARRGMSQDLVRFAASLRVPVRTLERALAKQQSKSPLTSGAGLGEIHGVGPVFGAVLARSGVSTVQELAQATEEDRERIRERLGRYAGRLDQWMEQAQEMVASQQPPGNKIDGLANEGGIMTLKRGDKGESVRELQRRLNRLGSLLLVDGNFGSSTEIAVVDARRTLRFPAGQEADDDLLEALAQVPEPSAELTAPGVTFVAREEVSSPSEYRRRYKNPVWPTPNSGITIGIGYDLKFVGRAKLNADWGEILPPDVIDRLAAVSGVPGSKERLAQVDDIEVPLLGAVRVFLDRMMPEHVGHTRSAYPELDSLPPHRRTALISLVFNRGKALEGERRREMKRIAELLAAGDLEPVALQLEAMTRLWDPVTAGGVIERRRREARLWRDGFQALLLA